MECEKEEGNLPEYVKDAGPPPHLDKTNAWKNSWRALEDMYMEHEERRINDTKNSISGGPYLESIGVSNFELEDMKSLIETCRIKPSLYQGNLWIVMFNPYLMTLLRENRVVFQAYNIMNGALQRKSVAPRAFSLLTKVANNLSAGIEDGDGNEKHQMAITESMVLISWLVQDGIAVIPRASSSEHQLENSPLSIGSVPQLSGHDREDIKSALSALMRGEDLNVAKQVEATFHNVLSSGPILIHWSDSTTGAEIPVTDEIHPGNSHTIYTHPGHTFVVYDQRQLRREFVVTASYGEIEHFSVDEL